MTDPFSQFLHETARARKARAELFEAVGQGPAKTPQGEELPHVVCGFSVFSDGTSGLYLPDGAPALQGVSLLMAHLAEMLAQIQESDR